jgi:hypothetical protein
MWQEARYSIVFRFVDQSFDLIEGGDRFLAARNNILGCVEFSLEKS